MERETGLKPLKILHLASHNVIKAGGAIQMMRLALGHKELGHQVVCAFNIRRGDRPPGLGTFEPLENAGIPVFSFPMQKIWKYYGMYRFRQFAAQEGFDVIHAHRFRALQFAHSATAGMAAPGLVGDKKNSFPIPKSWAKLYASPRVDCIVVNARLIKNLFAETGIVPPDKVEIIYNGVDLDQFHPGVDGSGVRESLGIDATAPLFGMIANFAGKKSHDIFFSAAIEVLKAAPEAMFLLVGGGDHEAYRKQLIDKGYGKSFVFTGFRSDIPQIIAALDFSVISSKRGEGLTGSIVEAMAMGKPVVSTAVAGNPEFVHDNRTGMLVPPGNADLMANAMLYLLKNRGEAGAMGEQARAFVIDKVDNRKRSQRFEALYRDILSRKGIG